MTQAHEARNGSFPVGQQAASSNTTSPDFSDSYHWIKRNGLTASVYRAPSGQWAWRLTDSLDEEIGGGGGYDDEGNAATAALAELTAYGTRLKTLSAQAVAGKPSKAELVERITTQMMAALKTEPEADGPRKEHDAERLAGVIREIDAIVQSETRSMAATARTARRTVMEALETSSGALVGLLADLGEVLGVLSYQAGNLSDVVNIEAEAVGCNHVSEGSAGASHA